MAQLPPKYGHMASCANPIIQNHLRHQYGSENVCWPIVWIQNNAIQWYTYELTNYCDTNSEHGNRPRSRSGKPNFFVDYLTKPRRIVPNEPLLSSSVSGSYECSYDYITKQSRYVTLDLDYVWRKEDEWLALEFTTFWVPFNTREIAEDKVAKINRRPTWRRSVSPPILKQIEAAEDLGCVRYIMGCVNTVVDVSNEIKTDGNAVWFDLDPAQVNRLVRGEVPTNANFDTFRRFLSIL